MPPFSIAEFADLVSSALALDDDIQPCLGSRWDFPPSQSGLVGNATAEFEPDSPITRARRNAFDLSSTRHLDPSSVSLKPPSFSTPPASPHSLSHPEPQERSFARSLSLNFAFASAPFNNNPSTSSSATTSPPPVSANNHPTHINNNLPKSNPRSGSSPSSRRSKNIKFIHSDFEKRRKHKNKIKKNGTPGMLLAPPPSDPAVLAVSSLGGGGGSANNSKTRRASVTGLRLGLGIGGSTVESGWERNAMDASGTSGRSIAGGVGKLLPRISISGSSVHSGSAAAAAPSSPTSPTTGQGQGPMKLFAKLKRQLSKNNVRPGNSGAQPASSPTALSSPFPSSPSANEDCDIEYALSATRSLRHSQSVSFASPTSPSHARSDEDWELVAAASVSTLSLTSASSNDTIGSAKGKKKRGRKGKKRRSKGSHSPSASEKAPQSQPPTQILAGEEGDTSPSLYSCESAPRSYVGSSESFLLHQDDEEEEDDKLLPHAFLRLGHGRSRDALESDYAEDRDDAHSTSASTATGDYAPYLPLIIQHERLQQRLKMPIPFAAVTEHANALSEAGFSRAGDPPSPRSRKASASSRGRGGERKRTMSGTSRGQTSALTSTSVSASASTTSKSRSRKRPSNIPLPPQSHPPPAIPPPACPPSPSPPPRRASAPDTRLGSLNSHPYSLRRAVSPFSDSSVRSRESRQSEESRESRESVDSRGPVTPSTPFFTASEASSVVVAGDGSTTGSGSLRSSEDASFEGLDVTSGSIAQSEKEKFSTTSIGAAVPVSPRSSYASTSGTHRSLSPTSGKHQHFRRAASPTPLVSLTRRRSRQTLAVSAGPASPPPSGPLPPPPPFHGPDERERKERARHSTPVPLLDRAERNACRRGSSFLSTQPSCDWPLHHHPSSIAVNMLSTPEARSFSASASAPTSPTSVRSAQDEVGRRALLADDLLYLSSSSSSLELQNLYRQGGAMTTSDYESASTSGNYYEDITFERDYCYRQQRQSHLLSRPQGHWPCPSNGSASTCDTSAQAAAALLAANTRANAGVEDKIGFGRQQIGVGKDKPGMEWTLCLGCPDSSSPGTAATHVCASGVTPDSTPVVSAAPVPSYVVSQQQGIRKAGLAVNKTSLPSSASRPSSGFLLEAADLSGSPGSRERCKSESAAARISGNGRKGKEDWTLSLPMPPPAMPEDWAKKIDAQISGSVVEDRNVNVRHSAPAPSANVVITVEDVDDPKSLDVDPTWRMSMRRSSMTSDPRVGEIVLCVPRVVSSGSGIEDIVMDKSKEVQKSLLEEEFAQEVQPQDPILEQKERIKANTKSNLAKLDALSADLARFNDMLRGGHPPSSRSRLRASMPLPPKNLKHVKSYGVLEVDEPPPKNAVLRMPSVDVFLNDADDLRSELDMGDDDDESQDESENEDAESISERASHHAERVLSSMPFSDSAVSPNATRTAAARLSATSLSSIRSSATMASPPPSPNSSTTSRIRAPLPFIPFPPPTSFAPNPNGRARKSEAPAASINAGSGVSGVLASGLFGTSVNGGVRTFGRTQSSSTGRVVSAPNSIVAAPSSLMASKPALKLQTSGSAPSTRPSNERRPSVSSVSSHSTTSTATATTPVFPSSLLVPSPLASPLETPLASSFPAPPPLSFPSLADAVLGRSSSTSKSAKENARPSTTSSETSVSSVGTDETILPSVDQRMRMRLGLLGTGLLGSVESDHEREGTDEESTCSGTYYSARSSFSSEKR